MKTKIVSFETTKKDGKLIRQIVGRAMALAAEYKVEYPRQDCEMDITACHANGNRLDLQRLLAADEFNFSHDVFGIRRHINRQTGQLKDCFVPRMSHHEKEMSKTA